MRIMDQKCDETEIYYFQCVACIMQETVQIKLNENVQERAFVIGSFQIRIYYELALHDTE